MATETSATRRGASIGRRAALLTAGVIIVGVTVLVALQYVMLRTTASVVGEAGQRATAALLAEQIAGGVKWGRLEVVQGAVDKLAALESANVGHVLVLGADGAPLAQFDRAGAASVDLAALAGQGGASGVVNVSDLSIVTAPVGEQATLYVAWPTDAIDAAASRSAWVGALAGLAIALAAIVATVQFLNRAALGPVQRLTAVMTRLAGGDNDVVAPGAERTDEIGEMARAVVAFRTAALERLALARDADAARTAADAERRAAERERETTAQAQSQVVASLGEALSKLADGDVTHRLSSPFPPEYEGLRTNFNTALEALQQSLGNIARNAEDVRSSAGSISAAAEDLSQRTESQAASLEESAAAIEEIASTTRSTADGASQAASLVANTKGEAETGGKVVRDAVAAMSEIETSSEKIGQIIGVIDEIAFQTNLLALNAGVEAARAGEAGKGFAVVAQEVRALAQRSADAAKQIKDLIMSSKEQVERGVKLVDGAGTALDRIISGVAEINAAVARIAESAAQQAGGLQEVSSAVGQMDQITQKNASMVDEVSAATSSLSLQTDQFADLISRFRTGYQPASKAAPRPARPAPVESKPVAAKPVAAAAKPASKAAPAPVRAKAAAPVRVSAPAPQRASAAVSEAGWEEF